MAITNSKQAADFLNKRAPKGESLAFINESEARLLKANGGMGLPLANTGGVPVYGMWGDAWEAAKEWGKKAIKNVDFGEWVDIGTKAWDTYAKYKSEKGQNEQGKATYDKYLQDTQNYDQAAEIAIAENLTPMAVATPPTTKAGVTDFTLVKDGGIIGLKNGGRPGYMMGEMVMEEETMSATPVSASLDSIPPEMQAISQELFQKAVEELTEQELQMLMAYMEKAAMESSMASAPMEEEMMTSETIMAANGGIMNAKRGLVDGPGGYAGEYVKEEPYGEDLSRNDLFGLREEEGLPEPRGNPGIVEPIENFVTESEMIVTEPVGTNSAPNAVSKEEQYLIEGGIEFEKQLIEIYNAFQQRFPGIDGIEDETFTDMIAMLQAEGVLDASNGKLAALSRGLQGITPTSITRTKQRIARGDTAFGSLSDMPIGVEFNSGGGAGIEALRKVRPDVVETMGFNMGGRAMYNQGVGPVMDQEQMMMASAPDAISELNDMALMVYGVPLDQLTETQRLDLEDLLGSKNSIQPQETGIMQAANGGRAMYAYGQGPVMNQGIGTMMANDGMEMLDMGGMEKDYRFNGGFVPMGEYEKKDDVPARLSKNEFVFTADAVRAAGGGSIQKGAKRMYDTMKNLEAEV